MSLRSAVLSLAALSVLAACGATPQEPYTNPRYDRMSAYGDKDNSIFGPGGLTLFGGNKPKDEEAGIGIGVNNYLWRASLDTLAFMPLASADPFGGVIITDWYSPAETPHERFKVNVYILDRQLRSDGLRAAIFRQRQEADGRWVDAPVEKNTQTDLENAILTRARQLRVNTAAR